MVYICGIGGIFWKKNENIKIKESWIKFLTVNLTSRGEKAWGIFDGERVYKTPGDFKIHIIKVPDLLKYVVNLDSNLFLIHTRMPTRGSAEKNENNHPFVLRNLVFAHNGTVEECKEWKDSKIETDSYQILKFIDKKWNRKPEALKEVIEKNFKTFGTSQACWLYDQKNSILYLWCARLSSLYYYDCDLFFAFASTKEILKNSLVYYEFDKKKNVILQRKVEPDNNKILDVAGNLLIINLKKFNIQTIKLDEPRECYYNENMLNYWHKRERGYWNLYGRTSFGFAGFYVYDCGHRIQIEAKKHVEFLGKNDIPTIANYLNKIPVFHIVKKELSDRYNITIDIKKKSELSNTAQEKITKIQKMLKVRATTIEKTVEKIKYTYVDCWCVPLIAMMYFGEENYFKVIAPLLRNNNKKETKIDKFIDELNRENKKQKNDDEKLVEEFLLNLNPMLSISYGFNIDINGDRATITMNPENAEAYYDGLELLKSLGISISKKTKKATLKRSNKVFKKLMEIIFEDMEYLEIYPITQYSNEEIKRIKKYLIGQK